MDEKKIQSYKKLFDLQMELKVPKNQVNEFAHYKYRSCEDILEAVKPLLQKINAMIKFKEKIIMIGDRYYIEATAVFIDFDNITEIEATAYAREDETQSKKDGSQVTGSTSSYAKKYALNSLLCIDDTKDSDYTNKHGKGEEQETPQKTESKQEGNKNNQQNSDGFDRQKTLKWLSDKQKKATDNIKTFLNNKLKEHEKKSFWNCNDDLLKSIVNEIKEKFPAKKTDPADECLAMVEYIEERKEKNKELINEALKRNDEPFVNMLNKEPLKQLYDLIKGKEEADGKKTA